MPDDMPVSAPVTGSIVAITVLALVQLPPFTRSVRVVIWPTQTAAGADIGDGNGTTVAVTDILQPVEVSVYTIGVVPAATPVAIPDVAPIVATVVMPLLQVPVPVLVSTVVCPTHMLGVPPMAAGSGLMVITLVVLHPVAAIV